MKNPFLRSALAAAAAAGLAMGLTACSDDGTNEAAGDSDDVVKIVTSTKVWANVADAVVGDADGVEIQPIIESNDLDPHSYQPTAADMALVEQADVLLAGGGHYDAWLTDAASSDSSAIILTAIEGDGFDGHGHGEDGHGEHDDHDHAAHEDEDATEADDHASHDHDHGHDHEVNEHIWYNTEAVTSLASTLADEINAHWNLGASDEDVVKRMEDIEDRKADLPSAKTAQTHPLADDIISGTKIEDITPEGYRSATLSESEPAAADVAEMLELIESGDLDFLIDSPQTRNRISERLMQAAQSKGLRIINVYESPDSNENFFDLYDRILDSLEKK